MLHLATFALIGLTASAPSAPTRQDPAATPLQAPELAVDQTAEWTEDKLRVLTLAHGVFLRSRCYFDGEQWQLRQGRDWMPMDASYVVKVAEVKDLLRESAALERTLKLKSTDDRATLAAWQAEHGLLEEALQHLDINLRRDPNHAPTLALLTMEHFPLYFDRSLPVPPAIEQAGADATAETPATDPLAAWEQTTRELLDVLTSYSPATRELLWQQIDPGFTSSENQAAFLHALTQQLAEASPAHRAEAAHILKRLAGTHLEGNTALHQQAVHTLIQRAALDGTENVRVHATLALAAMDDPVVAAPFVRALASPSPAVRLNVTEALGTLAIPSTAPALIAALAAANASGSLHRAPASSIFIGTQKAYIQDYDVEIATGAAIGDPQINVISEGAVLDVRIIAAHQRVQLVQQKSALRKALGNITGQDFKYDTDKWSAWIAEHPLGESPIESRVPQTQNR
jgi:hypothetical protein